MIKVVIVDDERFAIRELEYILNKYEELELAGGFTDPMEAMENINKIKPEVVFLDIDMPEISGFTMAQELLKKNENMKIIFVTAFNDYAIKAFEIDASDYILKPFSEERINKAILRILKQGKITKNEEVAAEINKGEKKVRKIPVWENDSLILIDVDDVLYCKVKDGELVIVTKQALYKGQDTLSQMEDKLKDFNFMKCHRNYIVNLNEIQEIVPWVNGTYILKLNGIKDEIPVSRSYNKILKSIFKF